MKARGATINKKKIKKEKKTKSRGEHVLWRSSEGA